MAASLLNPWTAMLGALILWWFSTGAILWAVRRAEDAGQSRALTWGALPLLMLGLWGVAAAAAMPHGPVASWTGFLAALALWGWIELAFLTGAVMGPSRARWAGQGGEGARFRAAWATIAWHEIALTAAFAAVAWLSRGAVPDTAFWTFAILYGARISAKLNLFYGAPRINTEFLPTALAHLPSHFRQGPVSWVFPISIVALTLASGWWVMGLIATRDVHFALLTALCLLALAEHWLMILPLPDAKLWRWAIPASPMPPCHPHDKTLKSETRHGF